MPAPSAEHLRVLRSVFKLSSFRDQQNEAIQSTLDGQDILVSWPTGAGKSLAFQFPPCVRKGCFTVVVGPLMALMEEQAHKGRALGMSVAVWNSSQSEETKKGILPDLKSSKPSVQLLYTTPESLYGGDRRLRDALKVAHSQRRLLSVAIDEAHCISEWGPTFRKSYLLLKDLKKDFPGVSLAALSATMTPRVQQDVSELLTKPVLLKLNPNRPNIEYQVHPVSLDHSTLTKHLVPFLQARRGQAGIIYCNTKDACDRLAYWLVQQGLKAEVVHAAKEQVDKSRVLKEWTSKQCDLVIATTAFGMGIDRDDVRWVVHWGAPFTVERFMQESGRAGRDGRPSLHVVYACADEMWGCTVWRKPVPRERVQLVHSLCFENKCRRQGLLHHFDELRSPCGADPGELLCDVCKRQRAVITTVTASSESDVSSSEGGLESDSESDPDDDSGSSSGSELSSETKSEAELESSSDSGSELSSETEPLPDPGHVAAALNNAEHAVTDNVGIRRVATAAAPVKASAPASGSQRTQQAGPSAPSACPGRSQAAASAAQAPSRSPKVTGQSDTRATSAKQAARVPSSPNVPNRQLEQQLGPAAHSIRRQAQASVQHTPSTPQTAKRATEHAKCVPTAPKKKRKAEGQVQGGGSVKRVAPSRSLTFDGV